jgi:hypothetical protein
MFSARRLSLNRYESVVALTPNITLASFTSQFEYFVMAALSRRSVGIDAAFDLGQAFVVAVDHASDGDRAANDDGANRN